MSAAPSLRFDLRPSLKLACLLVLAHGLALAAVGVSLTGWPLYVAGFGVLLSGIASLTSVLHRPSRSAVSLELHHDGRAYWRDGRGKVHEGRLGKDHFVSAALVVMGLEQTGRARKWVVLMADSASREDLRRLRVQLRWFLREDPAEVQPASDRNNPDGG
ncbi:MAG TPA: protein YgfX [Burkholderiales bacterium]|nr:protein YgfX [Burkholderiales bacterium]